MNDETKENEKNMNQERKMNEDEIGRKIKII